MFSPTRVAAFVWILAHNACLTQDRLKKIGFSSRNRCYLCEKDEETANLLFLQCTVTTQLWGLIFNLIPALDNAKNNGGAAQFWSVRGRNKDLQKIILTVPACIWWSIRGKKETRNALKESIVLSAS